MTIRIAKYRLPPQIVDKITDVLADVEADIFKQTEANKYGAAKAAIYAIRGVLDSAESYLDEMFAPKPDKGGSIH